MLQAISGSSRAWHAAGTDQDLVARVYQLESRLASLESTIKYRLDLQKSQIWIEIWEERAKVLVAIAWGVTGILWLRLILHWLG